VIRRSLPLAFAVATLVASPAASRASIGSSSPAIDPGSLLVDAGWLAEHLDDPGLVLLHVGAKEEYEREHIPGARYVSQSDLALTREEGALYLELPKPEVLRATLEGLGISDDSRIVVYYGNDWVSPATRVIFTLQYAGLGARTSLLDGGMNAWARDGHAVTAELPPARAGSLSPLRVQPIVVDAEYVRDKIGKRGFAIVDARNAAFYDGVQTGGMREQPHRAGHIAGAKNIPFTELADDRLLVRPAADLAALFAKAGVQPGDTVVAYCHIGQQATATLFAARTLGYPVLLYDGSYEDWSRRAELPVENPAAKK
jgi:thiosulfate/3-mercaptopyruvate sulfurtransferase